MLLDRIQSSLRQAESKVNKKALSSTTAKSSSAEYLQTRPFAATNDSTQASPNLQKQSQKNSKIGHSFGQILVQPKLIIGDPGDKYEQEADNVAAQVVQKINEPSTQLKSVQRQELGEEDELQMKPESGSIQREEFPDEDDGSSTENLNADSSVESPTLNDDDVSEYLIPVDGYQNGVCDMEHMIKVTAKYIIRSKCEHIAQLVNELKNQQVYDRKYDERVKEIENLS